MTILSVSDIRLEYGTDIILQKINFSINEGDRLGIVGVNGAGKSTLLRIIAGTTEPSGGNVFIAKGKSVGMLEQNAMLESEKTLTEEMESAFPECKRIENRLAKFAKPDRIAALTYLSAVGSVGGDVLIKNTDTSDYRTVLPFFEASGCELSEGTDSLRIKMNRRPSALRDIRTMPYPGFPTDAQAPLMAMACVARGNSMIVENIFEGRFKHVGELVRMGARIRLEGRVALIEGTDFLYGTDVECPDLRGGAALAVAGLAAKGETRLHSVFHIDRGYERLEECLRSVGADVERVVSGQGAFGTKK